MLFDAFLHVEEGGCRFLHLARAAGVEIRHRSAHAEAPRSLGQVLNGFDLLAQEEYGDGDQHQGRTDQPGEEDRRARGAGALLLRQEPEDEIILQLNADIDVARLSQRIDADVAIDAILQIVGELLVDEGEQRLGAGGGKARAVLERKAHLERSIGGVEQTGDRVGRFRRSLVKGGDEGDLAGNGLGQGFRHIVPMPLHDDEGHDRLQENHGSDDDDQGTLIEPVGQVALEKAVEPPFQAAPGGLVVNFR